MDSERVRNSFRKEEKDGEKKRDFFFGGGGWKGARVGKTKYEKVKGKWLKYYYLEETFIRFMSIYPGPTHKQVTQIDV